MRFSDARIDAFIEEDVPYIDLTCEVLGIRNQPGEMEYFTRESCVLAGIDAAHAVNPACEILTTRKSMPGAKDLLTCAVMAGGAFPHRLGLSETVLVFEQHLAFFGGFDRFVEELPRIKARCVEKKLFVEADAQRAIALAKASADGNGADGIQLDKVAVGDLADLVKRLREIDPRIAIIAAGGINPQNAGAYAACGVDGLATTAPFTAKPVDMSVRMRSLV